MPKPFDSQGALALLSALLKMLQVHEQFASDLHALGFHFFQCFSSVLQIRALVPGVVRSELALSPAALER